MARLLLLSAFACLFVFAWNSPLLADDLTDLQGKWEMKTKSNGVELRVVKTIEGTKETLEVYEVDKLVQKHIVEFELTEFGPAKVFSWKLGQIVAGPRTGQKLPDGRCIYRLEKDMWIGVHGMLSGDLTGVLVEGYKRIAPPAVEDAS